MSEVKPVAWQYKFTNGKHWIECTEQEARELLPQPECEVRELFTRADLGGLSELSDEEASRAYETMHDVISMSGYGGDGQLYRVNAMKAAFNRVIQDREAAREFLGKVDG